MNRPSKTPNLAQQLYQQIAATRAGYRRCGLHGNDEQRITDIFGESLKEQKPIPMVMYWAKGPRDVIGANELRGMDFLKDMLQKLNPPGVDLTIVFADTHVVFNGIDLPQRYMDDTRGYFQNRVHDPAHGIHFKGMVKLSDIVPEKQRYTDNQEGLNRLSADADTLILTPAMLELLMARGERYYQGESANPEQVAKMYYQLCFSEKDAMGAAFKDHVFLTYNHAKQHDFSVPTGLPAFCMNAFRGHLTDKPWNTPGKQVEHAYRDPKHGIACPVKVDGPCYRGANV